MANNAKTNGRPSRPMRRAAIWIGVILLLLSVPLIAMQFTREVAWGPEDFVFAGALMAGFALVYEVAARRLSPLYRAGVGVGLAVVFVVIWIDAAVGIFGD